MPPALDDRAAGLLMDLWGGQAAREGAFVLLAIMLVEGRPLNLVDQAAGDLKADTPRLAGDRMLSESLSNTVLGRLGIPATKGVFQSSTYRSGYAAPQANNPALARFAIWASDGQRTIEDLDALFQHLASTFAKEAFIVEDLPELNRAAMVYGSTAELIHTLLDEPSQGAFQQYLFAALLSEYLEATILTPRLRVVTKPLFQSDKSAGTMGDVEVRAGQNLEAVYEISASNWRLKLPQAIAALTSRDELTAITIVASQPPTKAGEITSAIAASQLPSGVSASRLDVAVLGVHQECLSLAARLSLRDRANAVRRLYDYLVKFCRTQPELVRFLVLTLHDLGLSDSAPNLTDETTPM